MIWLAIAAQLTAPLPANSAWLTPDDTPIGLMEENVVEAVGVAITVDPHGRIEGCAVETSSGNARLDAHTCKVATRRGKFRPARSRDGSPVYGLYRMAINWWVGDGFPPSQRQFADLTLTVSKLPPEMKSPTAVKVMVAVDASGRPWDCVARDPAEPPELVRLACEHLLKSYVARPVRTKAGDAVPSNQTATVAFETQRPRE